MINSHQFKQAAKKFRAGRISLTEFENVVLGQQELRKPNEDPGLAKPESDSDREQEAESATPSARVGISMVVDAPQQSETNSGSKQPDSESLRPAASEVALQPLVQRLTERHADTHKGDFGRVLVIGGSEGMPGSVTLTGMAALRSGSGLVKLAVPEMIQAIVAANNPCLMTIGCAAEGDGFHGANESSLSHHCEWADVVAIGPGMGRGDAQQWIIKNLFAKVPQPMVVDADGLNGLADAAADLGNHAGQRILTPHPGEFCRLLGRQVTARGELEHLAIEMARRSRVVIVLKGHQTLVTDGQVVYRNQTGNAGMATAGSGDVLTGVVTSLLGQGFAPLEASVLAVYLHGSAGDLAANQVGQTSLIATDIVDYLADAMQAKR